MKYYTLMLLASILVTPALAQEDDHGHRQLDAHVHGVSTLEIAIEGKEVILNLTSPGVDIVGFEHEASSDEDQAAIEKAIHQLTRANEIFRPNESAKCRLTKVVAELHEDEHEEHEDKKEHTQFDARYGFVCKAPDALTSIDLLFFKQFPNAKEIEAKLLTQKGAKAMEIERDQTSLQVK